jgi:hypothetical protein
MHPYGLSQNTSEKKANQEKGSNKIIQMILRNLLQFTQKIIAFILRAKLR